MDEEENMEIIPNEESKRFLYDQVVFRATNSKNRDSEYNMFLRAARCEINSEDFKSLIYPQNINKLIASDTVLMFMLKIGDVNEENYYNCAKILIENGVDINKFDYKGYSAVTYLAKLHEKHKNKAQMFNNIAKLLEEKRILDINNKGEKDFLSLVNPNQQFMSVEELDSESKLFYSIIYNKMEFFEHHITEENANADNGEYTLLQLLCLKEGDLVEAVQLLFLKKADPNKTTEFRHMRPLEIAALAGNAKIFREILKHERTLIRNLLFDYMVDIYSSQPNKVDILEQVLLSEKLDPHFEYKATGNKPLHNAIVDLFKEDILNSSLMVENKQNKTPLDLIDPDDLEKFFDSCLVLDQKFYASHQTYKIEIRFNCLMNEKNRLEEMKVLSKISKLPHLHHLLTHPFVQTFIALKWYRAKFYFWLFLLFQTIILSSIGIVFYLESTFFALVGIRIFFIILNIILKCLMLIPIFVKQFYFLPFREFPIHATFELILMFTTIGALFLNQFRAFIFVQIAICWLLTAGYHSKLSKWSLILQQVFKTFTVLLLCFSLIIIGFGIGFNILFPKDKLFGGFFSAIFRTYIMITGEFNIGDVTDFENSGLAGHLMFFLIATTMSLVIVNFCTGVALTCVERIERDGEVIGSINVINFMILIDSFYESCLVVRIFCKWLPSPYLVWSTVDFYLDRKKQFHEGRSFPDRLDDVCYLKMKKHIIKFFNKKQDKQICKSCAKKF